MSRWAEGSNIQDNCVVHVEEGNPVILGEHVTVGHGAILHGCRVGDNSLIGIIDIRIAAVLSGKTVLWGREPW